MTTSTNSEDLAGLLKSCLPLSQTGKVRDSYFLEETTEMGEKLRLVVVSDRVSIFDFPLGFNVPGKGQILNAYNLAARIELRKEIIGLEDDMVAFGVKIDRYLPPALQGNKTLQRRAVVVRDLPMVKVECVVRGHLTGTGYKAYKRGELICGHDIKMEGLQEGTALSPPIFTPTTKAEKGHDMPLDYRKVEEEYPGLGALSVRIYEILYNKARAGGITIADTKFEFGYRNQHVPRRLAYILADEVMTPDSSRFWDSDQLDNAFMKKGLPQSFDKQLLREWGKSMRIDELDPDITSDCEYVVSLQKPSALVRRMQKRMLDGFRRIYGMTLAEFQVEYMGIAA